MYRASGKKLKSIFTSVPDTPDLLRAKRGQKLQSQVRVKAHNPAPLISHDSSKSLISPGNSMLSPLVVLIPCFSCMLINIMTQAVSCCLIKHLLNLFERRCDGEIVFHWLIHSSDGLPYWVTNRELRGKWSS